MQTMISKQTEAPANKSSKKPRALALDALRGLAMLGMVFSGFIPHHVEGIPAWMYHAQVGPPTFSFVPQTVGITWVDLVFPFFLFAMGAAFPFALSSRLQKGESTGSLLWHNAKRAALLVFFAFLLKHLHPWTVSLTPIPGIGVALLALGGFLSMTLVFTRFPSVSDRMAKGMQLGGFLLAGLLLWAAHAFYGLEFRTTRSDIIIIVLANMAFFGSLVWLLTRDNPLLRLGILAFLLAMRLARVEEGSWNQWLWNASPATWVYTFYFCQYLFIVIPGTLVGDLLHKWSKEAPEAPEQQGRDRLLLQLVAVLLPLLVVGNLWGWYGRYQVGTLLLNLSSAAFVYYLLGYARSAFGKQMRTLSGWAAYWLLLGTAFEAYEGGIHKDSPTLSYYFVCSGLAIYTYAFLAIAIDYLGHVRASRWLVLGGQNPMVGYVGAGFVVIPVLCLLQLMDAVNGLKLIDPWLGVLGGAAITAADIALAAWMAQKKWFWRT